MLKQILLHAFQPNPVVAGAGVKLSVNDSEDLFRVGFSWGEWVGFWSGDFFDPFSINSPFDIERHSH